MSKTTKPKKIGHRFQPGISGNPSGRPKVPEDLKEARKRFAMDVEDSMLKYSRATIDELKIALEDKSTPIKDLIIIKILKAGMERADQQRFNFILDRTVGKVIERIDHTVETKPQILERVDGTEIIFTNKAIEEKK